MRDFRKPSGRMIEEQEMLVGLRGKRLGDPRELSTATGLSHPASVRDLIRRAERGLPASRLVGDQIEAIRHCLLKAENRTSRRGEARFRCLLLQSDRTRWVIAKRPE
jgi:hypothetical protein